MCFDCSSSSTGFDGELLNTPADGDTAGTIEELGGGGGAFIIEGGGGTDVGGAPLGGGYAGVDPAGLALL